MHDPLMPFLTQRGYVILDGALATELERRGADLADPLWSAKVLLESPELIQTVHHDYFVAGADVAITASYQATFAGFAQRGLDETAAAELMLRSVALARDARDAVWADPSFRRMRGEALRPLVAASVGPYGAYLADGSEYRGDYGLTKAALRDFHGPRLAVLAKSDADLLACETIPTLVEAEALVELLAQEGNTPAWLSFSCGDGAHLWHGESLRDAVALADACPQVVAVGINCTAPRWIEPLLASVANCTHKPLVVYPNSGEAWDAERRCWVHGTGTTDFRTPAQRWYQAGARLIGGCCRTTPEDIQAIAEAVAAVAQ